MQFTFQFVQYFYYGLGLAAPLLLALAALIVALGQIVGLREAWSRFDSLYWSFITATTVGYGDIRPLQRLSKIFAILIDQASQDSLLQPKTGTDAETNFVSISRISLGDEVRQV